MSFRVTVEDLETGEKQSREVQAGDYCLIPFSPCYLERTDISAKGTVQLLLRGHQPAHSHEQP